MAPPEVGRSAPEARCRPSVDAVYRIIFTALGNIGHFHFKSTVNGDAYTLAADAKIDTTIFDYRGNMSSNGAVPSRTPRPVDYKFNYKQKTFLKKKKLKALNIAFNDGAVSKVTFTPRDELSAKAVPVTPEQLKSVLDPLSGVMALSLTDITKPCSQKLPIYDGKQRFDLVFTPKGRSGGDHVCGVRLVPISGHKPGEGAASVIKGDIVLVMRPVPKANVAIPYRADCADHRRHRRAHLRAGRHHHAGPAALRTALIAGQLPPSNRQRASGRLQCALVSRCAASIMRLISANVSAMPLPET